ILFFLQCSGDHRDLHSFPTRRSSDLDERKEVVARISGVAAHFRMLERITRGGEGRRITRSKNGAGVTAFEHAQFYANALSDPRRSEEHTSELQSRFDLVCRLLLEKKK